MYFKWQTMGASFLNLRERSRAVIRAPFLTPSSVLPMSVLPWWRDGRVQSSFGPLFASRLRLELTLRCNGCIQACAT